ncbi:MAG: UDP-3-O-(3-hydroxymyristoyl)glucosamine N-acyltransferase [Bacteroidota bacterium]
MKITVQEVADLVDGEIIGDPNFEILNISKIYEAGEGDLTFLYLSSYEKHLESTKASVVLVKPDLNKSRKDLIYIEVAKPDVALQKLIIKLFGNPETIIGIDPASSIHPSVKLGKNVNIGKNVVISENCSIDDNTTLHHNVVVLDNSEIGNNTLIYPNVTISHNCKIGNNVIIHPSTVVGSDGFGYMNNEKGELVKVPQIGNVIIEDNVELGSNVSIDRAALGSTIIKRGVKIDNLVQIAHNVEVGENSSLSGQVGIAGSTIVGKNCIFGGQVGLSGHITVSDGVMVGAQGGVSKSLNQPGKYFGSPAKNYRVAFKEEAHIRNLEKYSRQIKGLEEKVKQLEDRLNKNKGNSVC